MNHNQLFLTATIAYLTKIKTKIHTLDKRHQTNFIVEYIVGDRAMKQF